MGATIGLPGLPGLGGLGLGPGLGPGVAAGAHPIARGQRTSPAWRGVVGRRLVVRDRPRTVRCAPATRHTRRIRCRPAPLFAVTGHVTNPSRINCCYTHGSTVVAAGTVCFLLWASDYTSPSTRNTRGSKQKWRVVSRDNPEMMRVGNVFAVIRLTGSRWEVVAVRRARTVDAPWFSVEHSSELPAWLLLLVTSLIARRARQT